MTYKTSDELLMEARALLPRRPSPAQALAAQANGALLIDIRVDGFDAVKKSRKQMTASNPVHTPVIGRAVLAGMRTTMRIINHLPPVKNSMARAQRADRGHDRH